MYFDIIGRPSYRSTDHAADFRRMVRDRRQYPCRDLVHLHAGYFRLVWLPFFKLAERKQLETEAAEENARRNADTLSDPIL